jgi:CYTH domain-containing protein
MGREIERKFLVTGDAWRKGVGERFRQGYLSLDKERTVRIRATPDRAYITVKGPEAGAVRSEFEYEIPLRDAIELLESLCVKPLIEKERHRVSHRDLTWEIDEFFGANRGLVIAEIELESEDQAFDKPAWVGREVTGDPRYYNVNLVAKPYTKW